VIRHFVPTLWREKPLVIGSTVALLISIVFRLLEPWPLKIVLDRVLSMAKSKGHHRVPLFESLDASTVLTLCALGLVVIVALRATSDYFKTVGFALVGNRVMMRIRGDLYRHLQSLSMSFHTKMRSGDLLIRVMGDIKLMIDVVITALLPLLASVLILFGMVAVMLVLNWHLTLLAMIVVPLFALSTVRWGRRIHDSAREQRRREGEMAASAAEAISSMHVVQAMSLEEHFDNSFSSGNKRSLSEGVKTRRLAARLEHTAHVLIAVATAMVLWYGARLVLAGQLTPGDLVVFLAYLKRGFRPLQDFAKYAGRLAKATAAGERIVELLEEAPDVQDAPEATPAPPLQGRVDFVGVRFGYEPNVDVYSGFELSIAAGQYTAVVGPSGVGKSTLLHLILRLYDPLEGAVLLDGHDLRQWKLSSVRSQISVVLQDTVLFAANVYDNIAIGSTDIDPQRIEAAARLANAHEFILRLPQGYQTLLGERGANLSHGQRQRIAIARAAIHDSPILLLDEPTTGLDEKNEREVRAALRRVAQGRTTILVTHELRHAADADVIFYLDSGAVQESGSHQQLLALDGLYAQLFRSQTAPYLASLPDAHYGITI